MKEFLTWNYKAPPKVLGPSDWILITVIFFVYASIIIWCIAKVVTKVEDTFFTVDFWETYRLDAIDKEERLKG